MVYEFTNIMYSFIFTLFLISLCSSAFETLFESLLSSPLDKPGKRFFGQIITLQLELNKSKNTSRWSRELTVCKNKTTNSIQRLQSVWNTFRRCSAQCKSPKRAVINPYLHGLANSNAHCLCNSHKQSAEMFSRGSGPHLKTYW